MRIIKRGALEQFWQKHPDAKASLEAWYGVVRKANWKTPAEMKQVYRNADLVGRRTVYGYTLRSVGRDSSCFPFHFVFFPAAFNLRGEGFSVVAAVTWIVAIMRNIVNLLAHPSLPRRDRRVAIVALAAAVDHVSSLSPCKG